MWCNTVFQVYYSVISTLLLSAMLFCLSLCTWSKSCMLFMSSNAFSVLSAFPLFWPTLVPAQSLHLYIALGHSFFLWFLAWLLHCLYHLWTVLWAFYHVLYRYILQLLYIVCPSNSVWIHSLFYVSFHYVVWPDFFLLGHWTVLLHFYMYLFKHLWECINHNHSLPN